MIQEPVPPTAIESGPPRRRGGRRGRGWAGLVVVACLALAVPLIGAFAASSSSAPTALGASGAPATSAGPRATDDEMNDGLKGPNGHANNGNGNGHGLKLGKGLKGNGGQGKGPISIAAVNGNDVFLATEDGWKRTITVTPTTVITKAGQTIGVADLKVGDAIRFHQVRNTDGSFSVDAIVVPTPHFGGTVTAVGANSITVSKRGVASVIAVSGSTVYTLGSAAASKSDVKVGSEIEAEGSLSGATFSATAINIDLPGISGQVTAKTGDTITLKRGDGTTATIHVSATTKYQVKGKATAGLADVAVGDQIGAEGALRTDGSLDAVAVHGRGAKAAHPD
ncbi:MAG: DUF5666 domain-containing protein, partial [Chloroflexota bacterium]